MRQKTLAILVLATGCSLGPFGGGPNTQQKRAEDAIFSYVISDRTTQANGLETVAVGGESMAFSGSTAVLEATTEDFALVTEDYSVGKIDQEVIPVFEVAGGSKSNTTKPEQRLVRSITYPRYLVELRDLESERLDDLPQLASKLGIKGHHVFSSRVGARVYHRLLSIRADQRFKGRIGFNEKLDVDVGGWQSWPEGGGAWAPNSGDFWWVGGPIDEVNGGNLDNSGPDDPLWYYDWGSGIKVAVVDSGFRSTSEPYMPAEIVDQWEITWNTVNLLGTSDIGDDSGGQGGVWHGRRMAGLIFGRYGDFKASLGTAMEATPLLVHANLSDSYSVMRGIDWAKDNGAKVISLSIGHYSAYSPPEHYWNCPVGWAAVGAANAGRIVLASTGNDGTGWHYPSAYSEVMGIGSHDRNGQLESGTNWWHADLFAPGAGVAVAPPPGTSLDLYDVWSGTSNATAIVAGVAAACHHRWPGSIYDTPSAISFLRRWSRTYPVGISLDAIYAVK